MALPLLQTNDEEQWIARELCKIRFHSDPQTFYVTLKQVLIQMCPDPETESDEETQSESEGEVSDPDQETNPKTTTPNRKRTQKTESIPPLSKRSRIIPCSLFFQGSSTKSLNGEIK